MVQKEKLISLVGDGGKGNWVLGKISMSIGLKRMTFEIRRQN